MFSWGTTPLPVLPWTCPVIVPALARWASTVLSTAVLNTFAAERVDALSYHWFARFESCEKKCTTMFTSGT